MIEWTNSLYAKTHDHKGKLKCSQLPSKDFCPNGSKFITKVLVTLQKKNEMEKKLALMWLITLMYGYLKINLCLIWILQDFMPPKKVQIGTWK